MLTIFRGACARGVVTADDRNYRGESGDMRMRDSGDGARRPDRGV